MTHSSHRFTMLSADDVALCRAHSRAVAAPPKVRAAVHSMCAAMSDCKQAEPQLPADLPMPPSYWDDLEHWLKTLAPAKPAVDFALGWQPTERRYYEVQPVAARLASTSSAADGAALIGVKPAAPAQQPAQKASTRHVVCIKAHICDVTGITVAVGQVAPAMGVHEMQQPGYWLQCDESGWVTHVPTADAVSPVPDGVMCQIKQWDEVCGNTLHNPPRTGDKWSGWDQIIRAWRPIAQS